MVLYEYKIPSSSDTLNLEAGRSSETLVPIRIHGVSVPEDRNRNIHRHENVASHFCCVSEGRFTTPPTLSGPTEYSETCFNEFIHSTRRHRRRTSENTVKSILLIRG